MLQRLLLFLLLAGPGWSGRSQAQAPTPTINDLTGINTRAKDPLQYVQRFSWVREYHDWSNDIGFHQGNPLADCPEFGVEAQYPEWKLNWNPSRDQSGPRLRYDDYYGTLYGSCIPALKGIAPAMRGIDAYPGNCPDLMEQKPFCMNQDGYNSNFGCGVPPLSSLPSAAQQGLPITYRPHANWMTLFAARYGTFNLTYQGFLADYRDNYEKKYLNANDPDPNQQEPPLYVGQGVLRYIEDNNEPNKSWIDPNYGVTDLLGGNTYWFFTPTQYTAMLSADYDGHQNHADFKIPFLQPGNNAWLGVKNAAPNMSFAMAGLTGLNGKYVEEMLTASVSIRGAGGLPPFDILNFHHYSTDATAAQGDYNAFKNGEYKNYNGILTGTHGVHPEADKLKEKLQWLRSDLTTAKPETENMELWLSEFGYDAHPEPNNNGSFVDVPQIDNNTTGEHNDVQKVQAQWLVRGVLEAAGSKSVQKMMLYEIRDEPSLYGSTFGYTGLRDAALKPKRAWYYVLTLKNVLGEYKYLQEIKTGSPSGYVVSVPSTRVYDFRNGNDRILAVWSPTATGEKYNCDITMPDPVVSATRIEIEEMDESGQRYEQTTSGNVITNIPVSETPVFIKVGTLAVDPPVLPIKNLTATSMCCEGVQLTWMNQGNTLTHRIYYVKQSALPNWQDFSPARATYYSDAIGANATSVFLTGLESVPYWFFVFPVDENDNLPEINATNLAPSHVGATPGSCVPNGCLIDIQASWISPPSEYNAADKVSVMPQLTQAFSADGVANACTDLSNITPGSNVWNFWVNYTENYATITFPDAYIIDAVYIMDVTGNGRVRFEYDDCVCWWQNAGYVQLPADNPSDPNFNTLGKWVSATNIFPGNPPIHRLRITKLDNVTTVGKILFCGHPATCGNTTVGQPSQPSHETVRDIRTDGALLSWRAAHTNAQRPQSAYVPRYRLQYSQNVSTSGALVNPTTVYASALPTDATVRYRLANLSPNTTYHVDIVVDFLVLCYNGLISPPPPRRVVFTTSGADVRGRNMASPSAAVKVDDECKLTLQPNPATDEVMVRISAGGLVRIQIFGFNGQLLKDLPADGKESFQTSLATLPKGILWVRATRTDGSTFNERLIKI